MKKKTPHGFKQGLVHVLGTPVLIYVDKNQGWIRNINMYIYILSEMLQIRRKKHAINQKIISRLTSKNETYFPMAKNWYNLAKDDSSRLMV
jgi:hypothetical protein